MTYEEILKQDTHAYVEVDENGFIVSINRLFTDLLGWDESLVGKPLTEIIPSHMQDAHHMGFSRFVMTQEPTILEVDLNLPTQHESGREISLVHHIAAGERDGDMRLASMIRTSDE